MTDFFSTFSHAALQDNLVLIQLLGVSAFIAGSGRLRPAMELSQLMFLVLVIACMANLAWHHLVLQPLGLSALQLPVFATTGAMIATATYGLLLRYFPLMARRHDFALLFFGGGSAVVGTSLLATTGSAHFAQAMAFSLGSAAGFCLLLVLVAAVRERLEAATIPDAFRGAPITLISAGIISLCLYTLQAG